MITAELEGKLHQYIQDYCEKCKGVRFIAIGGIRDHIHLLAQHEPFDLGAWVGKVKGSSSHELNAAMGRGTLQWQRGYGAVSFAKHDLDGLLKYVANQKEHHAKGTINRTLEQCGIDEGGDDGSEES